MKKVPPLTLVNFDLFSDIFLSFLSELYFLIADFLERWSPLRETASVMKKELVLFSMIL